MSFGTLTTLDDLQDTTQTIANFGEEALSQRVAQALALHNAGMQEELRDFAVITDQIQFPYGTAFNSAMQELDEFGSPDVQKITAGGNVGLPLRFYGIAKQWTRHFVLNTPVNQLLAEMDDAADADIRNVRLQIGRRLLTATNLLSYFDRLQTRLTVDLRALLNADGQAIPPGPNGESFTAGSHTHYLAISGLTEAFAKSVVDTVVEHGVTGGMAIYIARADEAAWRAFTDFTPFVDVRIQQNDQTRYATGGLDVTNPGDRVIGLFDSAEVHVKPFIPANYMVAFDRGAGNDKALGIRTRGGSLGGDAYNGGFGTLYEADGFPLRARALGREFGVGVIGRHKAAAGYSGGASYVSPTMTAF